MVMLGPLSFVEIGERWPDALVLWDRDVAGQGWTPVFWGKDPRVNAWKLSAFDLECRHASGTHDGEGVVWSACRCVTWTGEAWITLFAERYEAVRRALRGEHIDLDVHASKMLWSMLANGCDAEVTPSTFVIPFVISGGSDHHDLSLAPAIISFLLDGVGLPESGHAIRRIALTDRNGQACVPLLDGGRARYVRFDDAATRTVFRIRRSEAVLAELGPDVPVLDPMRFVVVDRACPHCGRVPQRFRVLRGGFHVCMACGRSLPPP